MSGHEPNHRGGNEGEIGNALRGAKFQPDAVFEERLRARLIEKLPEPKRKSWWQVVWDFIVRDEREGKAVRGSRVMGAFGLGVVALMAVLFVALVLVRPSGMTSVETSEPPATMESGRPVGMKFGGELELIEASVEEVQGQGWQVSLMWKAISEPTADYSIRIFASRGDSIQERHDEALIGADLLSSNSEDWNLPTTLWKLDRPIMSSYMLRNPPQSVMVEVYNAQTGWTLTLEYQGHSLSTVTAFVWEAAPSEVANTEVPDQPTPQAPVAVIDGAARVAISGDGSAVVIETRRVGEWPQLWLVNRETGDSTSVAGGTWATLSADGNAVAFVIQPRTEVNPSWNGTNIINTYSGGMFTDISTSIASETATMPSISADGTVIAFAAQDQATGLSQIYVYDQRMGEVERTPQYFDDQAPTGLYEAHPSISGDGRYVVFYVAAGATTQAGVVLWDREQDSAAYVTPGLMPEISADGHTIAYLEQVGETQEAIGWINARAYNTETGESRWLGRVLDAVPDGQWTDRVFSLSADGSRIAFWSVLENPRDDDVAAPEASGGLGSAYSNRYVFVYHWDADAPERVDPIDAPHPPGISGSPSISANGSLLVYVWRSINNDVAGVFVRDLITKSTQAIPFSE